MITRKRISRKQYITAGELQYTTFKVRRFLLYGSAWSRLHQPAN